MAKKPKPHPPSTAKLARLRARTTVGAVPPTRLVPDQRRRPEKHKRDLAQQAAAEPRTE